MVATCFIRSKLYSATIVVMQATEYRLSSYLLASGCTYRHRLCWIRQPLANALMRSGSIEIEYLLLDQLVQLPLIEDQQVVKTLTTQRTNEPFTKHVEIGRLRGNA